MVRNQRRPSSLVEMIGNLDSRMGHMESRMGHMESRIIELKQDMRADREASEARLAADRKETAERLAVDRKEAEARLKATYDQLAHERKESQQTLNAHKNWLIATFFAVLLGLGGITVAIFVAVIAINGSG